MSIKKHFDKLYAYVPYCSSFSLLYHSVAIRLKKPKIRVENGMFIISIDVDVGNKELGLINSGKNDANVHNYMSEFSVGKIEEQILPLFVDLFNDFGIEVTFAIRGQLAEVGGSTLEFLLKSPIRHEIGAHGYYHRQFTNLSRGEAESELRMISISMKKFGITPRSFVFPKNSVAHLDLLEKYGYKCYRGNIGILSRQTYIEKRGRLYNVPPCFSINQRPNFTLLKELLDITIAKKIPFHVWFHLWNFGKTVKSVQRNIKDWLLPLLEYGEGKARSGLLSFETMLSASEKTNLARACH